MFNKPRVPVFIAIALTDVFTPEVQRDVRSTQPRRARQTIRKACMLRWPTRQDFANQMRVACILYRLIE